MRISDWSSDVCSSDLHGDVEFHQRDSAPLQLGAPIKLPCGRAASSKDATIVTSRHPMPGRRPCPQRNHCRRPPGCLAGRLPTESWTAGAAESRVVAGRDWTAARKSVEEGKGVAVRGDVGGRRTIKK